MNVQNNTQVVIIEDEAHNSRMLKGMVEKLRPDWQIETILESVEESVEWFNSNKAPDLILMDIQLSDGICFSIFPSVNLPLKAAVIFTTAYDEYAIRAFKVNSIDYLLKPVNEKELENSFLKFEEHYGASVAETYNPEQLNHLYQAIISCKKEFRTRFLIAGITGYQKLETRDIAYLYSDSKLAFAVDFHGKEFTLDYNLEQLENELDPKVFFRANRKIILNADAVVKIQNEQGGKLIVKTNPVTDFEILVSRLKAMDFKVWMGK